MRVFRKAACCPWHTGVGRFNMRTDKREARRRLGIREDRPCVLIMSGSMGFGDAGALIRGLLEKYADGISIVLLGGSNRRLKESVRTEFGGRENVTVVDFTPPVSLYMDAADLLLTKPGGLTTTEFAVKNIPAILTRPIRDAKQRIRVFASRHMAAACSECKTQLEWIDRLLNDPEEGAAMINAQRCNINRYAAKDICDYIMRG